ncbi:hypothetical protein [Geofilum rubicundum]|uniref:hypothetical protein n=1 Tax=Geofilum rubicundum TaxID=472113 RepID=UPI0012F9386A|nr:hypothetical protein [Geofilum rubicundum]
MGYSPPVNLLAASVFDSKYMGGDGVERHTSFNRTYVFNLLGGKEWGERTNRILNGGSTGTDHDLSLFYLPGEVSYTD